MLRSLIAAISGLRVNQTMLDVTGNNIANSNTTGFKSSKTVFQDTLSQMLTGATGENANRGGTNPIQVGLGVQLAGTATSFTQGSNQTTGAITDLMIQGDGFFVVRKGAENLYTRAGAFAFDEAGYLVNPSGSRVQGYTTKDANGEIVTTGTPQDIMIADIANEDSDLLSFSIGSDGIIRGVYPAGQVDLGEIALATFANPMGLDKTGETTFRESANSGAPQIGVAADGRKGTIVSGSLEMSNVDLAAEFTNLILAQRGFQANSRVITTSDQVLEELVNIKR
jgi:flagellar hook protein FlgE